MLITLALVGCGDAPTAHTPPAAPEPERLESGRLKGKTYRLSFNSLPITDAHLTAPGPSTSPGVLVGYEQRPLAFHTVYKRGDHGFGDRVDIKGDPIDEVCNEQDFNALFEAKGATWLVSHFECAPGEMYITRLQADDAGVLSPEFNKRVDFSAHKGLWNPCAGMITPWGTHLGSEEYEPNAARIPTPEDRWDHYAWERMQRLYLNGAEPNPYHYGWTPEVAVMTVDGDTLAVKHKSPGRFSHEINYVMPDERTVYMTDDGRAGGLYMFVADKPGNLAAGKLYTAMFKQTSDQRGGAGSITWLPMGWSDDAYIDALIHNGVRFDDLYQMEPDKQGVCPKDYVRIRADNRSECLMLKPNSEAIGNMMVAATRLETRRTAAYIGGTTEFEKSEGLAFDPERKQLYISFAKIGGRMKDEGGGVSDHIRLKENPCGAVWSGPLRPEQMDRFGKTIDSEYVLTELASLIAGTPIEEDAHGNTCLESGIANPDNIAFLPYYRLLTIAEDTSRHSVAMLWSLDTQRAKLERMMVAPPFAEFTGIQWSPNIDGHGYLTVAIQHPWAAETVEGNVLPEGITPDHQRSITGYLGPFPPLD